MDEQFLYDFCTGFGNSAKFARFFDMGFNIHLRKVFYFLSATFHYHRQVRFFNARNYIKHLLERLFRGLKYQPRTSSASRSLPVFVGAKNGENQTCGLYVLIEDFLPTHQVLFSIILLHKQFFCQFYYQIGNTKLP